MPKHVAFSGFYSNTSIDDIQSINTSTLITDGPVIVPPSTLYSAHEPNNFTLTVPVASPVRLRWRNPSTPLYDGGNNLIKFPYRGVYNLFVYIEFSAGEFGADMEVRLRDTVSGATTPRQIIRVGGANTDMEPFLFIATWVCNTLNDRVEILAQAIDVDVQQVGLVEGGLYALQTFE